MTVYVHSATERQQILIAYLLMKVQEADWHGVSDAANDLRVLEAEHPQLQSAPVNRDSP